VLDHGVILNPQDDVLIEASRALNSKVWLMSLNGEGEFCNPSAENIAKEIFLAMQVLFSSRKGLNIHHLRLYETPNCYTDCTGASISRSESTHFMAANFESIFKYREEKGILEYDERKQNGN